MDNSITLNLHQTARAVAACVRANRTPLVIGSPGVAKTALVRAITPLIGRSLGHEDYPIITCILSNMEAVDVGGLPVVLHDGSAARRLFGSLRVAAETGGLLNLDELTACSPSVQGPALRLVLEKFAGDTPLHDRTRIVCLANHPDHAPGGIQMTAALVNRVVVLHCRPSLQEVVDYFCGRETARLDVGLDDLVTDEATWTARRTQIMATAGACFEVQPDLVCFDPPAASVSDGQPFGSPRAWEACCEVLASLPGLDGNDAVVQALAMGAVGAGSAIPFLSIMRARMHLPTVKEVLADPKRAKVPSAQDEEILLDVTTGKKLGRDVVFATIPLTIEVARVDTYAALLYMARLPDEIQAAVVKTLASRITVPSGGSHWAMEGHPALLAAIDKLRGYTSSPSAN
jgi:hypothetical protein